jgi:hypothetical protein
MGPEEKQLSYRTTRSLIEPGKEKAKKRPCSNQNNPQKFLEKLFLQEFQDLIRSEGSYLWYKKHC